MILKRFSERLRAQDWVAVAIELAVVVAGILLALQVDQWASDRAERQRERAYLERLADDLRAEQDGVRAAETFARNRLEAVSLLEAIARGERVDSEPPRIPWAVETASWRSFPKTNAYVVNELQASGQMGLLRSVALRNALADHYAQIAHFGRVAEDLSAQQRYDAAVAGLLTTRELAALEETGGGIDALSTDGARAEAIAVRFAASDAAIRELPGIAQHHLFNLRVMAEMEARIDSLLAIIERELDR